MGNTIAYDESAHNTSVNLPNTRQGASSQASNGNAQVDARQVTAVVNLVQTALNTAAQSAVNASQAANADAKASQPSFSPVYAKLPRTRLNSTKNWEHSLDFHDDLDLADYRKRTFMCLLSNTPYKEEYVTEKCVAFFEMGWPAFYYYWYSPTDAASHIRHLMATESIGDSAVARDKVVVDLNDAKDSSRHFRPNGTPAYRLLQEVEENIMEKIRLLDKENQDRDVVPVRYIMFSSQKSLTGSDRRLSLSDFHVGKWRDAVEEKKLSKKSYSFYGPGAMLAGSSSKLVFANLSKANEHNVGLDDDAPLLDISTLCTEEFWNTKSELAKERYTSIISEAAESMTAVTHIHRDNRQGMITLMIAMTSRNTHFLLFLSRLLSNTGVIAFCKSMERFRNRITVISVDFKLQRKGLPKADLDHLIRQVHGLFNISTRIGRVLPDLYMGGKIGADVFEYGSAVAMVAYYFLDKRTVEFDKLSEALKDDPINRARLRTLFTREKTDPNQILSIFAQHIDVLNAAYADFFEQLVNGRGRARVLNADLVKLIKDCTETNIAEDALMFLATFNAHVVKTNFYKAPRAALAFRLDCAFMDDLDYPQSPFGIFFVFGNNFQGLHVRFSDIARGGIRVVRSRTNRDYHRNRLTQFWENYSLAYTQNLKNKDIPEKGSKGTILVAPGEVNLALPFRRYIAALLDVIGTNTAKRLGISDRYGAPELLFLGPDENTADFMNWAALYARKRGYPFWRSFTTGKSAHLGGIPHDRFGMTTHSVRTYLLEQLAESKLDKTVLTKLQTGGPDGDLGSNEILEATEYERYTGIVDGSGVLHDPNGIDMTELRRLATKRAMIHEFDVTLLSDQGFRVLCKDENVTLPDGTLVPDGTHFRNVFHLSKWAKADVFVPCGGRPEAINLRNVAEVANHWRFVIEGANLFITQDARLRLEEAGVVLFKDASANKGGVTSSSREVLAALSLADDFFTENMAAKDVDNPPAFYLRYVKYIKKFIHDCAHKEFEIITKEHKRTGIPRYQLTDRLSARINEIGLKLQGSAVGGDKKKRRQILKHTIPEILYESKQNGSYEELLHRIPDNYQQAMYNSHIASNYVYEHGLSDGPTLEEFVDAMIAKGVSDQ